ncbi:MAG: HAD-IA family hydrolase [Anaerolineae bacterium]|nr:HAD-IA family hydrolase [Anaerolineae bacterium]
MIEAIVFDFGGVFTRNERSQARLREFDALLGWPPGTMQQRLFAGEAWELASIGAISPEEHWARVGRELESRLPPDFRHFRGNPFHLEEINDQVVALAQRLRRRYRLALCSNALASLADLLEAMPQIKALFEVIVISALVGLRKPDPRILELTAELLGLPLGACLLVDDRERNVRAAEAAGMPAVLFQSATQLEAALRIHLQL